MKELVDTLRDLVDRMDAAVDELFTADAVGAVQDDGLLEALTLAGQLERRAESVLIELAGEAAARSGSPDRDARLTSRAGCHDVSELLQRATRVAPQTAAKWQRVARVVRGQISPSSGEMLPPFLPALRAAMTAGDVGVDGVLAVSTPLSALDRRVAREEVLVADEILAAEARGIGPDAAPPACADLLRVQALAWSAALDQDGAEPAERAAAHRRGVTLGPSHEGLVPLHGRLLPEVAAQLQRIFDAMLSPRAEDTRLSFREDAAPGSYAELDERPPVDDRRHAQRQHDALATALGAAAASGELPTIGGAAPTLVVSMREEDFRTGRGWAYAEGTDEPLSPAAARHVACCGSTQRIRLDGSGRITRLGTEERVFNRYQRRAIALRDGGCVIPGCGVPAGWCEIHHVTEHAAGGPTHTDNGVLLCWFHHRFLDRSGWSIRMNRGVPEVRAPGWNDARRLWRPVTRSRTRLLDLVGRRT
jgi:hypothetical protein